MKNKIKLILIFYFLFINFLNNELYANINIKIKVNNEIITNIDIEKEAEYLKILNPNLNQLNKDKVIELAKRSSFLAENKNLLLAKSVSPEIINFDVT